MEKILRDLREEIAKRDSFAIYGAGEFASILVQYCSRNGLASKIVNCIVTKRDASTPAHILGIPVVELGQVEWERDMLFVIAVLSGQGKLEIETGLKQLGYQSMYCPEKEGFRAIYEALGDFSAGLQCELRRWFMQCKRHQERQQKRYEDLALLIQSMPVVAKAHQNAFGIYKDINKGKIVAVCAPGPSLNQYKYNDTYVHIGLNAVLFQEDIKLDYYFNQHIPLGFDFHGNGVDLQPELRDRYLECFKELECVKFIGQKIGRDWMIAPPFGEISNSNYRPYYISDIQATHRFCADIRYGFLYGAWSIIFPALQFALFTNPEKILIIGSDGYSASEKNYFQGGLDEGMRERLRAGAEIEKRLCETNIHMEDTYKEFQKFARISYPNTEIVMVNPVHFKGIFKETGTDENGQVLL